MSAVFVMAKWLRSEYLLHAFKQIPSDEETATYKDESDADLIVDVGDAEHESQSEAVISEDEEHSEYDETTDDDRNFHIGRDKQFSIGVSLPMQPTFKPISMMFYPNSKSKVPNLPHGPTNSTRLTMTVRQACLRPLLAHPDPFAPLALVMDASTTAMDSVLQQRAQDVWQLPAFFSRKLSPVQQKYSAYGTELEI